MSVKINDVLTATLSYLDEAITTEVIKSKGLESDIDVTKLIEMITDIRFQLDFTLMGSATEVQELYDKYRNRPVEESNIEIRTLLDLASYIQTYTTDSFGSEGYMNLIARLRTSLTLHSDVDSDYTCQDASITETMKGEQWTRLLNANPWLVAAVCIRLIPGYYIVDITINKFINDKVDKNEARRTD